MTKIISLVTVAFLATACSEPFDTTSMATPSGPLAAPPADTPTPAAETEDIVDTAAAAGSFNTLIAAVKAAELETTLRGSGPFTVFAPTDAAFAALPAGTVEDLLKPENKQKLVAVLTYHVLPAKVMSAAISSATLEPATVQGSTIKVVRGASGVTVNDANVVTADVDASNGVIHVIDKVILPPG